MWAWFCCHGPLPPLLSWVVFFFKVLLLGLTFPWCVLVFLCSMWSFLWPAVECMAAIARKKCPTFIGSFMGSIIGSGVCSLVLIGSHSGSLTFIGAFVLLCPTSNFEYDRVVDYSLYYLFSMGLR
ncbi:hypothetical protein U1Q18_023871 [Sarracenia purpurea var. burkii]